MVLGEDDVLLREGIARLLTDAGFDVVSQAGDADGFLRKALAHKPDVAVVDIQMPPGLGDDGLRAALELREQRPGTGILVLSQYYEEQYALDLIGESAEGVGYLLKERVGDVEGFTDAVARVAAGGSALDPEVVARMVGRRRTEGPLDELTPARTGCPRGAGAGQVESGHRRVAGRDHRGGGEARDQHLSQAGSAASPTEHRRVLAALTYLRDAPS